MRRGEMVATLETAETSPSELAELMVGRRVLLRVDKGPAKPGEPCSTVEDLDGQGRAGRDARSRTCRFEVRAGEIVGIAGVAGNGQSSCSRRIAGIREPSSGRSCSTGKTSRRVPMPADDARLGLAHVPEDRHAHGPRHRLRGI